MSYLNIIRMPLAVLPFLVIALVQAKVSMDRVNGFLNCSELDEDAVTHEPSSKLPIEVKNGTFKWGEEQKPYASLIVGTSPQLEMAVYTVCILTRQVLSRIIQNSGIRVFSIQSFFIN